jgi:hypothetical protein
MRITLFQIFFTLALNAAVLDRSAAEEFKYYVWIDDQGIVHASQEAPKGRDYEVRIIEDVNANVVPAEDFTPYGEPPPPPGEARLPGDQDDGAENASGESHSQ